MVQKALYVLLRNKAVLVVAHWMKTVGNADKFVVLDKGLIIEQSTHEELIKN